MVYKVIESMLFWLSQRLLAMRRVTLSMLCGRLLLRFQPRSARGFDILARSHFFAGNYYESAAILCEGLLSLKPERGAAIEVLTRASGFFGESEKSMKYLAKVVQFYLNTNHLSLISAKADIVGRNLKDPKERLHATAFYSQDNNRGSIVDHLLKDLQYNSNTNLFWTSIEGRMILNILILCCQEEQRYDDVIRLCTVLLHKEEQSGIPQRTDATDIGWYAIRAAAYRELGQYDEALKEYDNIGRLDPIRTRHLRLHLQIAFLWGLQGRPKQAVSAFSKQWRCSGTGSRAAAVAKTIFRLLQKETNHLDFQGKTAFLFEGSTTAFGHVMLDPFHAYNLARSESDEVVLVIPPLQTFGFAMNVPLALHAQVMTLLPTKEQLLLDLCWLELGNLHHNDLRFIVHNYWSLNRKIFEARSNPDHPLSKQRRYLKLPPDLEEEGRTFCEQHGIDLNRPIVVVHAREQKYHNLNEQSFRNVAFDNYIPALKRLNDSGYQIVRVGDSNMHSIRRMLPAVFELPFVASNAHFLDAFFISHCDFMISCQSGPCSIARVMGKPTLVVNAVYHHTLIPEAQELVAFKAYYEGSNNSRRRLSANEIFARNLDHVDKASQLTAKDIYIEELSPEEIDSSVEEMQHWLTTPSMQESSRQAEFRELLIQEQQRRREQGMIDWYIGYSLPECRLSDTVSKLQITTNMSNNAPGQISDANLVQA